MISMVILISWCRKQLKKKRSKTKKLIDKLKAVVIAALAAGLIFGITYVAASAPVDDSIFKGVSQITQRTIPQPLEDVGANKVELFI